jgi:CRP-like cAMP-binding protein
MAGVRHAEFRTKDLSGQTRTLAEHPKNRKIFSQGDPADRILYIQQGRIKPTVLSSQGKDAVAAILWTGNFFGEGHRRAAFAAVA